MKRRHLLMLGGAAVGGYLLYKKSRPAPTLAGLGSVASDAQDAGEELASLLNDYNKIVAQFPAEYALVDPAAWEKMRAGWPKNINEWMRAGDTAKNSGRNDQALNYYGRAIGDLKNMMIPTAKLYLQGAAAGVAALRAGQDKVAAREISQAPRTAALIEDQMKYARQNVVLEAIDKPLAAIEKPLKAAGDVLGIEGNKGFFENMSSFVTRMKWYAIAGLGIYGAIKFGPSILAWLQSRKGAKLPSIPSLQGETQTAYVINRRRR